MQVPPLKFKHISEIIDNYDLLLFDLWGVIIEGEKLYTDVISFINKITEQNKKVFFVSNAPRPAFALRERLQNWGLKHVSEEGIITSGDVARSYILEKTKSLKLDRPAIYHLGDENNTDLLARFDHILVDDLQKAQFFLLSLHRDESQSIREFDELLKDVAKTPEIIKICANPDITVPNAGGIARYCAGYFAKIIEQHGGEVVYTGKPKAVIYDNVFKLAKGIRKDRILMIGDSLETDILGAQEAGIDSALVMTGNAYKIHSAYHSIEDKLQALQMKAYAQKLFPTFVIEI